MIRGGGGTGFVLHRRAYIHVYDIFIYIYFRTGIMEQLDCDVVDMALMRKVNRDEREYMARAARLAHWGSLLGS